MNLTDFPVLTIDSENPVGSFKNWLREFEISVELATLVLGTEEEDVKSRMFSAVAGRY